MPDSPLPDPAAGIDPMLRLIDGHERFRSEVWPSQRARYEALDRGQSPETMVIACADSRVDPQTIFDAAPGELFVVRNVAALVPPCRPDGGHHGVSAALEFAVRVLQVRQIVVLGHARCGGVRAAIEGAPPQAREFVEPWVSIAAAAVKPPPGAVMDDAAFARAEMQAVRLSLRNLLTFPWIERAVFDRRLRLRGGRFDILSGMIEWTEAYGGEPG